MSSFTPTMAVTELFLICTLLSLHCVSICGTVNDDIAFEDSMPPIDKNEKISNIIPVQRGWGIPDTQAIVSKLFVLKVPKEAFKGDIDHYEVSHKKFGKKADWPKWLEFSKDGTLKGVPLSSDVGIYLITISAVAPQALYKSKDVFSIEVIKPGLDTRIPEGYGQKSCPEGVDPIMLSILMDVGVEEMEPKMRVSVIENISGYLGYDKVMFYLHEEKSSKDIWSFSDTFYFTAGHIKATNRNEYAAVSFQIGCGRKIDNDYKDLIEKIQTEALDGALSEVLMHPVVEWHAKNELSVYFRDKRQVGSGDLYGEEEEEEDYNEPITTTTTTSTPHPHRHHHGEKYLLSNDTAISPSEVQYQLPSTSLLINYDDLIATPVFIPGRPTASLESVSTIDPTRAIDTDYSTVTASTFSSEKTDTSRVQGVTIPVHQNEDNITGTTSDLSSYFTYTDRSSTDFLTTDSLKYNLTSEMNVVTVGTTEDMELKNLKPAIAHRLKKVAITAGKTLRFKIPENTFRDIEDGTTSHLSLSFKSLEGKVIPRNSWIKFDATSQEILAVPLEDHVSKWEFEVQATDSNGDSVSDVFELQIQHHKGHRTVNFEFSAHLTVSTQWQSSVDWELKLIDALVAIYGDPDSGHITVRSVSQNSSPYIFSWTNDTLPRSYCPRQEIDKLLKVIADENEDPTMSFQRAVGNEISIKKITVQGIGQCESKSETPTPSPPQRPSNNFSPIPRNQIDQVNATVGRLLVFKVPEDTFYDPEDGSTGKLKMSLINMDRSPLDPQQWLQFDAKNQEFYGVPMDSDVKIQEYQLVCEDKEGLTANDGLVVVVFPRIDQLYSVEFTIAVDFPYENFLNSSIMKRRFIEKLQDIFGDPTPDAIVLGSISRGSTIITWHNHSLRTDICPTEDIHRLREILINDDESVSDRLVTIMGSEFPVISVGLEPAGACQGELTVLHKPESTAPPYENNSLPIDVSDDYLFTFVVPAVLIALMLILSGIIACLFYRKKRNSKMGLGEDDEKQSFRNKGIPVIFQDELEEKPEPENKCPVIMKEEKPPLPPPEYQRSQPKSSMQEVQDDEPYQPPPPFTSSRNIGKNTRPKPTPTYRKPPPYVPP